MYRERTDASKWSWCDNADCDVAGGSVSQSVSRTLWLVVPLSVFAVCTQYREKEVGTEAAVALAEQ